ncbi:MAG: nucleotidyltransferase domain-containing protein [Roseiflexus castenholzii]
MVTMSGSAFDAIFDDAPAPMVWLFGSRASRHRHIRSDIDIAVLFAPKMTKEERERWRLELIDRPPERRLSF